jgi:hypothetical protein
MAFHAIRAGEEEQYIAAGVEAVLTNESAQAMTSERRNPRRPPGELELIRTALSADAGRLRSSGGGRGAACEPWMKAGHHFDDDHHC